MVYELGLNEAVKKGFSGGSGGKESVSSAGDLGSTPGSGRSLGEGNGYPLQHSCLENSADRGASWTTFHGVAKRWTGLSMSKVNIAAICKLWAFPGGSDGKESICIAGDPGSIPGSERSPGGGNGNPFQYSCPENSMNRGAWWATVHGVTESNTTE